MAFDLIKLLTDVFDPAPAATDDRSSIDCRASRRRAIAWPKAQTAPLASRTAMASTFASAVAHAAIPRSPSRHDFLIALGKSPHNA